jgi:hypothetical protein
MRTDDIPRNRKTTREATALIEGERTMEEERRGEEEAMPLVRERRRDMMATVERRRSVSINKVYPSLIEWRWTRGDGPWDGELVICLSPISPLMALCIS